MSKRLPHGVWITFLSLDPEITEQEIQEVIANHTGIEIPLENISINDNISPVRGAAAIVSFDRPHVLGILKWALQDDTIRGRRLKLIRADRKRRQMDTRPENGLVSPSQVPTFYPLRKKLL